MPTEEEIEERTVAKARREIAHRENLKAEYNSALITLEKIENAGSLTNAQVVQAVKHMAKVLVFILKHLAKDFPDD